MNRNRITYLLAATVVVILGLASRSYDRILPDFLAAYAGDTLWALTAFLVIGIFFPKWSTPRAGVAALVFAFAIEMSQLYRSPWVDQVRHTKIGGLVLGYGFLWSDLLCYVVGVLLGCALEWIWRRRSARR